MDIGRQVEVLGARYGNDFNAAEARLRQEDQSLTKQRGLLSKEAYKAKVKELRDQLMELRSKAQRQRTLLDRARAEAVREVQLQLQSVARELAGEARRQYRRFRRPLWCGRMRTPWSSPRMF